MRTNDQKPEEHTSGGREKTGDEDRQDSEDSASLNLLLHLQNGSNYCKVLN